MEKGFPKESRDESLDSQAISEHPSYRESESDALDSTGSESMIEYNDSNENDQVKGKKLKGIVLQGNGHWGAQLYYKRARIWLGTFETIEEAAKSYDRALIKFKGQHVHTNFPPSQAEKLFLDSLSCDEVVLLIRDQIYDRELQKWYNAHHSPNQVVSGNGGEMGENMVKRQFLFEKELTVSDVGKLNRLVIPKQHAERHFPKDRLAVEAETFLTFVDTSNNREWRFRFSFWESSKSYVLTKGWIRFVKNKDLKGGDLVSFSRDGELPSNKFYITVQVSQNLMAKSCVQDKSVEEKRVGAILSSVSVPQVKSHERVRVDQKSSTCLLGKRKAMEDEMEHESDDVIKLFGTEIGRKDVGVEIGRKAKETKRKDDEAEIDSNARDLFGIITDPEAKGQRDGKDVDLTLRL